MDTPTIETIPQCDYVALCQDVPLGGLGAAVQDSIQDSIQRVAKYLSATGLEPSGVPFVRYIFINMMEKLTIEAGFPLEKCHSPSDRSLVAGVIPSGDYVCSRHVGPPESLVTANAELQQWVRSNGIALDVRVEGRGEYWAGRFEHLLLGPESERDPKEWVTQLAYRMAG